MPNGWVETTLGECSETIQYGLTATSNKNGSGYRYVRITDIQDQKIDWQLVPFAEETADKCENYTLKENDILFARTGATVGKSYLVKRVPERSVFASYLIRVRCNLRIINAEYAAKFFQSPDYWTQIISGAEGTGQPNFNGSKLSQLRIPLPSLSEQRRIVEKVDALTRLLARARAELDQVPALVERLRDKALTTAFEDSQGVRTTLAALAAKTAPIRYGVLQPGSEKSVGVQLIRVCDLQQMRVAWSELRRISPEIDRQFANARVQDGDILISVVGTIGRVALVVGRLEPTNIARAIVRLRPDLSQVLPAWLTYRLISSDCQKVFAGDAREVARKTLNVSFIKAMEIVLPPLSEQAATVQKLDAAFAQTCQLEVKAARARALLDQLHSSILAMAFRGELVSQDPNGEPVSILLERMLADRADIPKPKRSRRTKAGA